MVYSLSVSNQWICLEPVFLRSVPAGESAGRQALRLVAAHGRQMAA
jgi:hypothetical protein